MLNQDQKKIVDYLRQHQPCTIDRLIENNGMSRWQVRQVLKLKFIDHPTKDAHHAILYTVNETALVEYNKFEKVDVKHCDLMLHLFSHHFSDMGLG